MDSKDSELKNALDEIFGDDVIEIDDNKSEDLPQNDSVFNSDSMVDTSNLEDETLNENTKIAIDDKPKEDGVLISTDESNKDTKKETLVSNKKVIIGCILGFIVGIILIYLIVTYLNNRQKIINCSYSADDSGYKVTDEYKITYKGGSIVYIEGIYVYTSKNEEYNSQIEYIKEDKLPVIINSNGMKGFTYTYENNDSMLKISSYLDYSIMDFDEIKKIDQDITPISYFKVNLEDNNKNLTNVLKKKGYKCTASK